MLFPLDYTVADVEDILAPGAYLLDVVDKNGELLGVTVAVSIGMPRNAGGVEVDSEDAGDAPAVVPTALPTTGSDVRLVLEANVRATQMAFLHNQRTLELGLRMAETLRDSVQVLASSQADWIKSVSSARGFFRTAVPSPAPIEVKQLTVRTGGEGEDVDGDSGERRARLEDDEHDDDGDDEDGDPAPPSEHWAEKLAPLVMQVMTQVMPAINAWSSKQFTDARARLAGGSDRDASAASDASAHVEHRAAQTAQPQTEERGPAEDDHARQLADAIAGAALPGKGVDVLKLLQMLPARTRTKLMQIQMSLPPDEQADAMQILRGYGAGTLGEILRVFDLASLEQCKEFIRNLVVEWRHMKAKSSRGQADRVDGGVVHGPSGIGVPPGGVIGGHVVGAPFVGGTVVGGPVASGPVFGGAIVSGPVVSDPRVGGPAVFGGAVVSGPVVSDPRVGGPAVGGSAVGDPRVGGPAVAGPPGGSGPGHGGSNAGSPVGGGAGNGARGGGSGNGPAGAR